MYLYMGVCLLLCITMAFSYKNIQGRCSQTLDQTRFRDSRLGVFTGVVKKVGDSREYGEENQQQTAESTIPFANQSSSSKNIGKNPFAQGTPVTQQVQGINPFAQTMDKSATTATGTASGTAVKEPFEKAEALPLPWTESVNSKRKLVYMDAMNVQLAMIESLGMECVSIDEKFICRSSDIKPARIGNMEFRSERFRKVRLTYFDAGDNVQVFNALWMPSFEYDAPMLGTDLISLGKQRILSVIDMQPLHPDAEYSDRYITIPEVTDVRAKYPDLHGKLSGKIYDDTSFFSKNMLFGRFTDESKLQPVVHPAHEEYLDAYINKVTSSAIRNTDVAAMKIVEDRQRAYDVYSALKDPAVGLFDAYFGKEWSVAFVHEFLFGLSDKPDRVDVAEGDILNMQSGTVTVTGTGTGTGEHIQQNAVAPAPAHTFKVHENGDVKFQAPSPSKNP